MFYVLPVFPGFGAISLCFMEKPFIDFSFSVGALDVMNIGPADMNVATVVDNMVRGILESMMLYPKKYVMPCLEEVDLQALLHPKPVGLLVLHLKSARNLIIADLFSSDPYVQFTYMETSYKTPIIYKTLNPTWNHTVELMVFDKEAQGIEFTLWDSDLSGSNDLLGRAKLNFSALKNSGTTDFNLELYDTTSGSLQVSCEYVALVQVGFHACVIKLRNVSNNICFFLAGQARCQIDGWCQCSR
jgi:Ca2+-dependent lipid-binding protein